MISVSNVSMRFGAKILFEEVTTAFQPGRRFGLTGPNGAGKSTFMKLLSGESEPQKGNVFKPKKLGVIAQNQFAYDEFRVIDTVIMGNKRLWTALQEREVLYEKPDLSEVDGIRLGELEGVVGEEDGYSADSDAAILLQGLGIPDEVSERKMSELQGGQKVRVLLAQALFGNPEALLLDEPTNHLDLDSVHWLETFLNGYKGTLIVISHDRHFLNSVCTHIADIDYETIITYTGGYDDMVLAKTQVRARIEADNLQRQKKIAQLQDFVQKFSAGTRASQVQSRKKEMERLQTSDLSRSNIARPFIKFHMKRPSGRVPLEVKEFSRAYGDNKIFTNFTGMFERGDKIAVLGRNGAGKTTLIKALMANGPGPFDKEPDLATGGGDVTWGHEVQIGYFAQDHRETITNGMIAHEWLHQFDPQASREEIRGVLGQMLFAGEEGMKPTEALSGGEAARLIFCRLMLEKPNFLIFDEPTNHLDLEAINALNFAIQKYEGTVILVTHDEDLVADTATRIWHLDGGTLTSFKGSYEEFQSTMAANAK
jgi:ATPase subunit of ABC transporter with duplicated ATPase domains